ncbi:Pollen-specific protein-like-like protein [Drosera capensis]
MDRVYLYVFLVAVFAQPVALHAQPVESPGDATVTSKVTVVGSVYCDRCFSNAFSRYSYFLPGAEVHIQCKFNADSPRTEELITFSVNRTTDKYGVYKLEIPSVDGLDCTDGPVIKSSCQATLLSSSSTECNIPASRNTVYEIQLKSKQSNLCIYSFSALSFRQTERNHTLCDQQTNLASLNSSKFFFSYGFSWPPLPQLPPLPALTFPPLPPFLSFPFPPCPFTTPPSSQFPYPTTPALQFPFPFMPLPPYPPIPSFFPQPPPPPTFNLGDPRTWMPHIPSVSFSPPPQPRPTFNPWDPRTWFPFYPPSQPAILQAQQP